jgi:GNAT superfamily N-acetyltransferase
MIQAHLSLIAVARHYRRQGIGRRLIEEAFVRFGFTQYLHRCSEPHLPLAGAVDASRETITGDAHGGTMDSVGQASPSDRAQRPDVQQGPF